MNNNEEILAQIARDVRTIAANVEHLTQSVRSLSRSSGALGAAPADEKVTFNMRRAFETRARRYTADRAEYDRAVDVFGFDEDGVRDWLVTTGRAVEVGSSQPRRRVRRAYEHTSA